MASKWKLPDYRIDRNKNNYNYHSPDRLTTKNNGGIHATNTPRYYKPAQDRNAVGGGYYHHQIKNTKDNGDDDVKDSRNVTVKISSDPDVNDDGHRLTSHREQQRETRDTMDNDLTLRLNDQDSGNTDVYGSPRRDSKGRQWGQSTGQLKGSWTDRQGNDSQRYTENPWTHRPINSPGMVGDPRTGRNSYMPGGSYSGVKQGGALLFIRFPTGAGSGSTENVGVACQAFLRSKTSDMGGKFLGFAKSVYDFGYGSGPREALGLYHFPSLEKAKLFFQYDTLIRQPDFPPPYGHAEMWIVSNAYLPDSLDEYNTFLLSEVMLHHGRDKREFFEVFQKPFEKYLSDSEVMPYVICSYGPRDRESLRRHAYHHQTIVTCHLFKGPHHLSWLTDQDQYLKFRSLHNQIADEKCTVFTIQRDLFP